MHFFSSLQLFSFSTDKLAPANGTWWVRLDQNCSLCLNCWVTPYLWIVPWTFYFPHCNVSAMNLKLHLPTHNESHTLTLKYAKVVVFVMGQGYVTRQLSFFQHVEPTGKSSRLLHPLQSATVWTHCQTIGFCIPVTYFMPNIQISYHSSVVLIF